MEQTELRTKLIETLAEEFEVDSTDIKGSDPLMETLGLDSLDMVDVVVIIEKNFGVVLSQDSFKGVVTFDDFIALLESRMK
ncbi:MAG: acyl carrier protein [Bacteroidales bacterium]|nr:acyl carrier protein [Bacteroidales bacterium]